MRCYTLLILRNLSVKVLRQTATASSSAAERKRSLFRIVSESALSAAPSLAARHGVPPARDKIRSEADLLGGSERFADL